MLNVSIIGVTGYAGEVLIDILLAHPLVRIVNLSAKIDQPKKISEIFPKFRGKLDLLCSEPDLEKIKASSDLVFLALPHTVSMTLVPQLLKAKKRVIDLSADYRLKDLKVFEEFYTHKHQDRNNVKEAVYGLPELYRVKIKGARLVANPGCYPTAAILCLAPLLAMKLIRQDHIIIDAKSGVTGAGRKVAEPFLFSEINEDFRAYKVNIHQHSPEIDQILSGFAEEKIKVIFVPHLLPLSRGIIETIYVEKTQSVKRLPIRQAGLPAGEAGKTQDLTVLFKKFYKNEPFVRIRKEGDFPRLKDVVGTNFCDISIKDCGENVIIIAAIDNLLKGASGQAVQNMNIMYNFPEKTALA